MSKIDIINIYTSLYPNRIHILVKFIWNVYNNWQLLGHKASLKNFQNIDILYGAINLEVNSKNIIYRNTYIFWNFKNKGQRGSKGNLNFHKTEFRKTGYENTYKITWIKQNRQNNFEKQEQRARSLPYVKI